MEDRRSVVFDADTGTAVAIANATKGGNYECEKGCRLVLKDGEIIAKHFSHLPNQAHPVDKNIIFGGETRLHKAAKELIARRMGAIVELRYPDQVFISDAGEPHKKIYYEVVVSHNIDKKKYKALIRMIESEDPIRVIVYNLKTESADLQALWINDEDALWEKLQSSSREIMSRVARRALKFAEGIEGVRNRHPALNTAARLPTKCSEQCLSCKSSVYNFKNCIYCCARYVIAARPSRRRQDMHMDYLTTYYSHDRQSIIDVIQGVKNEN